MKESIKRQLALSEVREQINGLLDVAERSQEQETELATAKAKAKALEGEYRAAVQAEEQAATATEEREQAGDGETVELRSLEQRSQISDVLQCVFTGRRVDGATAELQEHLGLPNESVPLALLREERAASTPPTDVGANQHPIMMPLFAMSSAAFLGVSMPTVAVGEQVYPVLSTRPTVDAPDKGAEVAETTNTFTSEVLTPKRLQSSFYFQIEDAARFAGMESALRTALNQGLSEGLDNEILNGDDYGLLHGTNLPNNASTAQANWAIYRSQLAYGRVDGRWANGVGDMRVVVGTETYEHMSGIYRSATDSVNVLSELRSVTGGVRVSALMPAKASKKQNALVRRGMAPAAVAPIWEGVRLIRDEVTKTKTGEIVVTAVMLFAFKIVRAAGFHKQQLQIAA